MGSLAIVYRVQATKTIATACLPYTCVIVTVAELKTYYSINATYRVFELGVTQGVVCEGGV